MDTSPYNDYVLDASLQAGWITSEQQQTVQGALARIEGASALDFLLEQQLLDQDQHDQIKALIQQSVDAEAQQPAKEQAEASAAATSPSTVIASTGKEFIGHGDKSSIDEYLQFAVESEASDLHLGPDSPPLIRYNGSLGAVSHEAHPLTPEMTEQLAKQFLTEEQVDMIEDVGAVDFCYEHPTLGRFRTCVVRQRRGWESVFRVISTKMRSMEELGLPAVMYDLIKYHNGLILVTGAVGSGKTTTLAAMVNQINLERKDHIITLEDPIEYVFQPSGCQLTQREVHTHTESFATALRGSLRQDPDVIMIGEMRDLETISLAITASETGHLVLGTLHTSNAARTMQRLLDVFPVNQQSQIRTMVSESIRGVICQQLVPRADGGGRALALEIMTNTPAVANLIREGKNFMLPGQMQVGKKQGMRLMDDSLLDLYDQGIITADEAHIRSQNKKLFAASLASRGAR
jgi:twitching motility protein PilT